MMDDEDDIQMDQSKLVTGLTTKVGFLWVINCIVAMVGSKCISLAKNSSRPLISQLGICQPPRLFKVFN